MRSTFPSLWLSTVEMPVRARIAQRDSLLNRADVRNVGLIALCYLLLSLFVPPVRAFPITDDWTSAQSVSALVSLNYEPHGFVQPTSIGHLIWGALASAIFGQSFTLLSIVNLIMSAIGVVLFYVLLRRFAVSPSFALLGCALLALNPIYLYVSYSYMTDVTFLVYLLVGCLAYIQGLTGSSDRWLWLGGIATALAYLTRQPGILLALVALLYLWRSGRWSWRRALAIGAVPTFCVVGYAIWEAGQPAKMVSIMVSQLTQAAIANPGGYVLDHLQSTALVLSTAGLCLLPLVRWPRRLLPPLLVFALLETLKLGYVFIVRGNVLSYTGLLMFDYSAEPLWPTPVWFLVDTLGSLSFALYITPLLQELAGWVRSRAWRDTLSDPVVISNGTLVSLAFVTFVPSLFIFDRYLLPLLPFMMVPALIRLSMQASNQAAPSRRWMLLLPLALFAILAQRDYMEHAAVRWQAAQTLVSQGIAPGKIDGGYEWVGWYLYADGERYIKETGDYTHVNWPAWAVLDREYVIGDIVEPGYLEIGSFSYTSWLNGGQQRYVLVTRRQ